MNPILKAIQQELKDQDCRIKDTRGEDRFIFQLPRSKTEWLLVIHEKESTLLTYAVLPYRRQSAQRKANPNANFITVSLNDPDSLKKLLAHYYQHSVFLKGGTNHPPKTVVL